MRRNRYCPECGGRYGHIPRCPETPIDVEEEIEAEPDVPLEAEESHAETLLRAATTTRQP